MATLTDMLNFIFDDFAKQHDTSTYDKESNLLNRFDIIISKSEIPLTREELQYFKEKIVTYVDKIDLTMLETIPDVHAKISNIIETESETLPQHQLDILVLLLFHLSNYNKYDFAIDLK